MTGTIGRARNPRNGASDYAFTGVDPAGVARAAARARAAQSGWEARGVDGRAAVLARFAQQILRRRDDLQAALENDTGRRRVSAQEIDVTLAGLAGWPRRAQDLVPDEWIDGVSLPQLRHRAQWLPYPVVGVISPWNFPLLLAMLDTLPALTAGCAVIVKPSEVTPRFAEPLQRAVSAVPELEDVLQIILGGATTGAALVDQVDCVCCTGSVATGRRVAVKAAARLIPAFLELGGKDPLIVLEDADLDAAATAALRGAVLATGQACQSIERIYVAERVHDEFLRRLVERARAVRLNWPRIDQGDLGPLIFEGQAAVLGAQLDDARRRGATVHTGGAIEHHGGGLWLRPTVLSAITHDMMLMREETFGPLLPVMPFATAEEAVALANFGDFGLSAAVFAGTLEAAEAVARRLQAGAVSLNDAALTSLFYEAPKQSFKHSGLGPSRMGMDGLTRFLRRKALIANSQAPYAIDRFAEDAPGREADRG